MWGFSWIIWVRPVQTLEDATLLALKMEEEATSQRMRQPLEARKGEAMDPPLELPKGTVLPTS